MTKETIILTVMRESDSHEPISVAQWLDGSADFIGLPAALERLRAKLDAEANNEPLAEGDTLRVVKRLSYTLPVGKRVRFAGLSACGGWAKIDWVQDGNLHGLEIIASELKSCFVRCSDVKCGSPLNPPGLGLKGDPTQWRVGIDFQPTVTREVLGDAVLRARADMARLDVAIREAIAPVESWYSADSRELPAVIADIVSDLQTDRKASLDLTKKLNEERAYIGGREVALDEARRDAAKAKSDLEELRRHFNKRLDELKWAEQFVEVLREIDRHFGCNHVEQGPDDARQILVHVEEASAQVKYLRNELAVARSLATIPPNTHHVETAEAKVGDLFAQSSHSWGTISSPEVLAVVRAGGMACRRIMPATAALTADHEAEGLRQDLAACDAERNKLREELESSQSTADARLREMGAITQELSRANADVRDARKAAQLNADTAKALQKDLDFHKSEYTSLQDRMNELTQLGYGHRSRLIVALKRALDGYRSFFVPEIAAEMGAPMDNAAKLEWAVGLAETALGFYRDLSGSVGYYVDETRDKLACEAIKACVGMTRPVQAVEAAREALTKFKAERKRVQLAVPLEVEVALQLLGEGKP